MATNPRTIHLGGNVVFLNDSNADNPNTCSAVITPGMIVEYHDNAGSRQVQPKATAANQGSTLVALEDSIMNKGIDDDYAIDDLPRLARYSAGGYFYGIVETGQTVASGTPLKAGSPGKLVVAAGADLTAAANIALYQSVENLGTTVADTRCRVEVL